MRYKSQALQRANGSKINADVAHYVYCRRCRCSFWHIAANLWHFFHRGWYRIVNLWNWVTFGALSIPSKIWVRKRKCNWTGQKIKNVIITVTSKRPCLLSKKKKKKKLSNDECFVIEWNIMMVMTKRILCLKRFRTFANEMTKRVVWWRCSVCVNGMECHEYTVDDSFIPCDTINYHKRQCSFFSSLAQQFADLWII